MHHFPFLTCNSFEKARDSVRKEFDPLLLLLLGPLLLEHLPT